MSCCYHWRSYYLIPVFIIDALENPQTIFVWTVLLSEYRFTYFRFEIFCNDLPPNSRPFKICSIVHMSYYLILYVAK